MKPVQGGRILRVALLSAVTTLMLGLSASAASASVSLSPEGPYAASGVTEVVVTGVAPAAADLVGVAVCNTTFEKPGEYCDEGSVAGLDPVADYESSPEEEKIVINVQKTWLNVDLTAGIPGTPSGGSTTCSAEQCAVEVSYYEMTKMGPKHLPVGDVKTITFL